MFIYQRVHIVILNSYCIVCAVNHLMNFGVVALWHFVILGCQDDPSVWTCQEERYQVWPSIREFALVSDAQRLQILHQPMAKVHRKKNCTIQQKSTRAAHIPWKNPIEGRCLHWCLRAMLHFSYHSNYSYLLSVRLFICYSLTTCLYNNSLNSCFVLVLLPESGKYLQHCCWRTLWPAPAYALLAESTYYRQSIEKGRAPRHRAEQSLDHSFGFNCNSCPRMGVAFADVVHHAFAAQPAFVCSCVRLARKI